MTLNDFKPNSFYLYKDDYGICIFQTYGADSKTEAGLKAKDIFVQSQNGINGLSSGWSIGTVYRPKQIKKIKEIDINDYPEYFI